MEVEDPAGVIGIQYLQITPDARPYAYTATRVLANDFYLVGGLE